MESAKKDYYRKHSGTWSHDKETEFRTQFDINEPEIEAAVNEIHSKIQFEQQP